ncbi:MAG: hypothetical protein ISS76_22095 [Phycisphaerae bacterium]|nr:hypothetical protein [Phycisphaerae bacterium]
MNVKKEPAARLGQQAASKNHLQNKTYLKPLQISRSNLKENLGLLLFRLQNSLTQKQHKIGWQLFEVLLTQYIQNLTECPSEPLKSKNSAEGGIG